MIEGGIYFEKEYNEEVNTFVIVKEIDDVLLGFDIILSQPSEVSRTVVIEYLEKQNIEKYISENSWYIHSDSFDALYPNGYLGKLDNNMRAKMIPFFLDEFSFIPQLTALHI